MLVGCQFKIDSLNYFENILFFYFYFKFKLKKAKTTYTKHKPENSSNNNNKIKNEEKNRRMIESILSKMPKNRMI